MALDEAANPQARDQKKNPLFATAGMAAGIGGGVAQGGAAGPAPAPAPRPSGGGGGGAAPAAAAPSDGVDWGALAALSAAGLSSNDIAALANGGGAAPAAAPQTAASLDSGFNGYTSDIPDIQANAPASGVGALPIDSDPALLALYAQYDNDLANTESGFRRQQDELRRNLADGLPDVARQFDLSRIGVKNAFEGRGLLKSGEAETAVGNTYEDQGRQTANMERQSTDQIANLEQQIAQARVANAIARSNAARSAAGSASQGVVGSVA